MVNIIFSVLAIVISGLLVGFIVYSIRKGASGLKLMLLGISIILVGGIIVLDPESNLGGFEYLIAFLGLIISISGLAKKD